MKFTKRKKKHNTRHSREYREEMWLEIGKAKIRGGDADAIVTAANISMSPVGRRTKWR